MDVTFKAKVYLIWLDVKSNVNLIKERDVWNLKHALISSLEEHMSDLRKWLIFVHWKCTKQVLCQKFDDCCLAFDRRSL